MTAERNICCVELIQTEHRCTQNKPVVTNGCEPSDVQHQRGVQWAWLGRLALRWRRAFVTQHARPSHPPQLGALPWLLHNNQSKCYYTIITELCLHTFFMGCDS